MRLFLAVTAILALGLGHPALAQVDPRTGILEQAGFDALKAGDAERAADAFREALAADPKNPELHLGAGVAAALQRRDAEAKAHLERALELNPKMDEARQFLGQILYRLGDLPAAIATYETLVANQPQAAQPAATLERWRREMDLQTRMRQTVGNHFTVSFEGPAEAPLADRALESLDQAYWRIGQAFGMYPAHPVAVVLYTSEQFRDITRSPPWAAGAYDGIIRVPMRGALEKGRELDRVLAHEFTHALVRSLGPRPVPTWLNEGLATALETGDLGWAHARLGEASKIPPLSALAGSFGHMSGAEAELAYAESAVAASRLLDAAGGVAIANLLRDVGEGVEFEDAFARRMPWTLADFAATFSR